MTVLSAPAGDNWNINWCFHKLPKNHLSTLVQQNPVHLCGYVYLDQLMHRVFFFLPQDISRGLRRLPLGIHALLIKQKWVGMFQCSGILEGWGGRTGCSGAWLVLASSAAAGPSGRTSQLCATPLGLSYGLKTQRVCNSGGHFGDHCLVLSPSETAPQILCLVLDSSL